MYAIARELQSVIEPHYETLNSMTEVEMAIKPSPDKWSKKQILGHLIDSAQANIRRFVVAQYQDKPHIVYNQDKWVIACNYQEMENTFLVNLWYLLNLQISAILENMPAGAKDRLCLTESEHTLEWLAEDYIKHLRHHLNQILNLEAIPYP